MRRLTWLLVGLVVGCRPPVSGPAEPAPAPSPDPIAAPPSPGPTTPPSDPEPSAEREAETDHPGSVADVPPAAPATLGVNDMANHPARWNGETVFVIARLRSVTAGCTSSVPPSCWDAWQLLDADTDRSPVVTLVDDAAPVQPVCRPARASLVASSPCLPDELDPTQRYRILGRFQIDQGATSLVAESIEVMPAAAP